MSWSADFVDILERDADLAARTYYRVGGNARHLFTPRSAAETARLLSSLAADGKAWRVLGGGANVLIDDGVHDVPIISLERMVGVEWPADGRVRAEAGVKFPTLVRDAVKRGLGGLEFLAGIPGCVGGACAMNAGGRRAEFGEVVEEIEMALPDGEVVVIPRRALGFGYRKTSMPQGVVTSVTLRLDPRADQEVLQREMVGVLTAKRAAQPLQMPSSGCIFRNPEGGSAGLLIESLGLKGERRGNAEISTLHGNFIVNHGGARFADIVALIELIESRAREARGIELVREVVIWPAE